MVRALPGAGQSGDRAGVLSAGWRGFESKVPGLPRCHLQLGTSVRRCLWAGEGQVIRVAPDGEGLVARMSGGTACGQVTRGGGFSAHGLELHQMEAPGLGGQGQSSLVVISAAS